VPKVLGMSLRRARARVASAGCRVGRVRRAQSRRRSGLVIAQSPRARTRLPRGSRVNLVVSRQR
jgi:beta-lactam-binding protein with PASTA domain